MPRPAAPQTPDGRYIVVRGRLWRATNPHLTPERRAELVSELMAARSAVRVALGGKDRARLTEARRRVHLAKVALGERGPVWWTDGTPDYNRHMAVNTPYRDWYESLPDADDPPSGAPAGTPPGPSSGS